MTGKKRQIGSATRRLFRDPSGQGDLFEKSYQEEVADQQKQPVECLGMTFENDDARRKRFLGKLREGLEELHQKLGGIPFTTVEDAVQRMKSFEHWPMASHREDGTLDEGRLLYLAERMRSGDSSNDLLHRWKEEVGFPLGEIEDILALSDPPYYTACPNPFLGEFARCYGKPYDPESDSYRREPFAVDVSEGKTDSLYKAHSYHTKVPHLAIVPSILHYTEPGDLVLDGFCGSGMTGVAAQWCGSAPEPYRQALEERWDNDGWGKPKWGARRVLLGDLSPAATFIAANYNIPFSVAAFAQAARRLLDGVEEELGWMYETLHTDGKTKGCINYTVWSEVFICPECAEEIVFVEEALDRETKRTLSDFPCPNCAVELNKDRLQRCFETVTDPLRGVPWKRIRMRPVLINYSVGKGRFEKEPDQRDTALLRRIQDLDGDTAIPGSPFPIDQMYHGSRLAPKGFTHVHQMFLPRAAQALAQMWRTAVAEPDERTRGILIFFVEQAIWGMSILARYVPSHYSQVNQHLTGVYYIASQIAEVSPWYILEGKLNRLTKAFQPMPSASGTAAVSTVDCARLGIPDGSVDYVFTDPPFGANIGYADLNFLVESWHRVHTRTSQEAVIDGPKGKQLLDYQRLMQRCFGEYVRVLKPGRWMTLVFHNSRNAVWNAIQEALQAAGFVVADVRTLDKRQGSYRQVTSTAVKQDLVISAYKPNGGLEQRFKLAAGTQEGVWDFVRTHLRQLPVFVSKHGTAEAIAERQPFLLFDRMVAFHVQRGVTVPLSAAEFYEGLAQRFSERDGMFFLPEQITEYDKKRMTVKEVEQLRLFVTDEASAIQWLRQQLKQKPQTFQEVHPQFMREIGGWEKHEKPLELRELLEENFLCYDGSGEVPSQIHGYLSHSFHDLRNLPKNDVTLVAKAKGRWYVPDPGKAGDLEKLRERALLREFWEYLPPGYTPDKLESTEDCLPGMEPKAGPVPKGKRIKVMRMEAVRAGFKYCWQNRDYRTIIAVASRIPDSVLQEDAKLLMWYDQAVTRTGE